MFKLRLSLLTAIIACSGLSSSCASKLPRDRKVHQGALEMPVNLSEITFSDLDNGGAFNLKDYMAQHNRQYLLLMFGSRGCSSCNQKSTQLRDEYLPNHFLFQNNAPSNFELIGVNTDPAHTLAQVQRYRESQNFKFIRWSDPRGDMLQRYFLKEGSTIGVPFTVLVSQKGILWRIDNKESTSVGDILARVAKTLNLDDQYSPNPQRPTPNPPGKSPDSGLPTQGVDRFKGLMVKKCGDASGTSIALADLPQIKAPVPTRLVQIAASSCNADCQSNHASMQAVCKQQASGGQPALCSSLTLVPGDLSSLSPEACANTFQGGSELRTQFLSYFDWKHTPIEDGLNLRLPEADQPWILGFSPEGKLVFSHEGTLSEAALNSAIHAPDFGKSPRGPDFRLYSKKGGEERFADLRQASDYTVFMAFEKLCQSCRKELSQWSSPGNLLDFCNANPQKCRVMAVEVTLPDSETESLNAHLDMIEKTIAETNNRVPLYLDPVPFGTDGKGYLNRIFDGYLTARYPRWDMRYGTVIYNKEGQIIRDFTSEETEGAFEQIKILTQGGH